MNLLSRLLDKFGVKDESELQPEEQQAFREYKLLLSKDPVEVTDIQEFCRNQISVIESNFNGKDPMPPIQQACLHVYINVLKAIDGKNAAREEAERHLINIIEAP